MPKLSGYQLHLRQVLTDQSKTFSEAVSSWKELDDDKKLKLKDEASKFETKPRKTRVKVVAPEPAPTPAPEPVAEAPAKPARKPRAKKSAE